MPPCGARSRRRSSWSWPPRSARAATSPAAPAGLSQRDENANAERADRALAPTPPRVTGATSTGRREWTSTLVPRYQRPLAEVNTAVLATYLAGGNTRWIRGAWRRCSTARR